MELMEEIQRRLRDKATRIASDRVDRLGAALDVAVAEIDIPAAGSPAYLSAAEDFLRALTEHWANVELSRLTKEMAARLTAEATADKDQVK